MKTKKRVNNHRVCRNIIALFLVFSALALAVYSYVRADMIKSVSPIRNVVFIGNKHLTDDELMALTGIHRNESLITTSNRKVSQGLLKSPWIRSVSVRKEFPDTLSIVIEEAVPFALLDMNGHFFLVDENGKLLEELKDNAIPFLPIITGDPFKEGKGFSEALHLAKLMNDKGFSSESNHIEIIANKPQELTVTIDGTVVKVGSGEYEEKLKRLFELEDEIKKRKIPVDYIDLRFANRVIVKPIREVIK
ncbi:MAG: FtsQ-type POTRA domain-containing protein [Nitrospirota bacterium]|nr:FtsQ-type POTRA domain-containing protein [Nitrospirota bacterium]MDH5768624.1 FtsQ-type POTRA domain-containing protein [Nitrospirota bacterium]